MSDMKSAAPPSRPPGRSPGHAAPEPPAPAPRKADAIADDLLHRIVRGELAPGALLPREEELAASHGVTRGVVREALRALETSRLIRPTKRRGTEVLDPLASISPAVLRAMLLPDGRRVDRRALADVLEVRAHLDALMNALAAERRDEGDMARIDAALARLASLFHEPRRYVRAMDDLALEIARATKNRLFEMLVHWHGEVARDLEDVLFYVRFPTEPQLEGVRFLVDSIRARDAETARRLTETFHEWASARLLEAVGGGEPASRR
jgi:GntR family transcriptional repressor for pyruvate dehydrogenase complex